MKHCDSIAWETTHTSCPRDGSEIRVARGSCVSEISDGPAGLIRVS